MTRSLTLTAAVILLGATLPRTVARPACPPTIAQVPAVRVFTAEVLAPAMAAKNAAIESALDRELPAVNLLNRPFRNAIDDLTAQIGINAAVAWSRLENAGVKPNAPTTLKLTQTTGRAALTLLLKCAGGDEIALSLEVCDGALFIDTAEGLDSDRIVRIYDLRDLIAARLSDFRTTTPGDAARDAAARAALRETFLAELTDALQQAVAPDAWPVNGGSGSIATVSDLFVVTQPRRVHRQVEAFLNAILRAVVGDIQPVHRPQMMTR